ncbi:MAG: single-stranded DNA-binding protein [Bacteroidaceae bacterium]|nr:single-stranded DNA-binding protein [Bacteroidaceae bacterium]
MNKVMLIGNVGQDPQIRYLDQNLCVAQLRLATTEKGYTLQNGTQVPDRTEWHSVIFWRKQAETVEKYVHKGDKLYVEGKLQYRRWTDKQGIDRTSVEIMVENFEFIGSPQRQPQPTTPTEPQPVTPTAQPATPPQDGEYPF